MKSTIHETTIKFPDVPAKSLVAMMVVYRDTNNQLRVGFRAFQRGIQTDLLMDNMDYISDIIRNCMEEHCCVDLDSPVHGPRSTPGGDPFGSPSGPERNRSVDVSGETS